MSSIGTMVINLMARTEAFEKSMDRASGRVESFNKTINRMSKMMGMGAKTFIYAKIAADTINMATAMSAAKRHGDNMSRVLSDIGLDTVPMLGSALKGAATEFSGLAAATEHYDKVLRASAIGRGLRAGLSDSLQLLRAPENLKEETKALIDYQNTLKKIQEYQQQQSSVLNPAVAKKDADRLRMNAKDVYDLQLREITAMKEKERIAENDKLRIDAENDKLQEKYSALEDILNAEQSYADTLRAEQGMTNEMISLLHIRERIEKTMQGAELEAAEKRLDVLQKDLELEKKISDQKKKNEYRNKLIGSLDPTIAMAQYMHELEVNGIDPNSLEYKKAVEDKYNSLSPPIEFQRGTAEVISGFSDVKGLSMNAKEPAVEKKFDEIIKILNSSNTFLSTISRQSWN